jgi:hypothetical protein
MWDLNPRSLAVMKKTIRLTVVGGGTMKQAGRSRIRFALRSVHFLNLLNPSGPIMALGLTASNRNEYQKYSWEKSKILPTC